MKKLLTGVAIKAVSLDVTGTVYEFSQVIGEVYHKAALATGIVPPPARDRLVQSFKQSFIHHNNQYPCYGSFEPRMTERDWWKSVVEKALVDSGSKPSEEDLNRCFLRIYQHYSQPGAYHVYPDVRRFLERVPSQVVLGITSNSPHRTVDCVLPALALSPSFRWFVSCMDIGVEKPNKKIFELSFMRAKYWCSSLDRREEILHIGDEMNADFCGARAAGFQALLLNRKKKPIDVLHKEWKSGSSYPGKDAESIEDFVISSLDDVFTIQDNHT